MADGASSDPVVRYEAQVRENLIDPGVLPEASEQDARAAREALRKSDPGKLRVPGKPRRK